ncbi:MAG: oligosaccharide flippase family protein [Pseudomonadota bacterium]
MNTVFNSLGMLARYLCNFLLLIIIARLHSQELLGQFTLGLAWGMVLLLLCEFGFHLKLPKELIESKNEKEKSIVFLKAFNLKNFLLLINSAIFFAVYCLGLYPGDETLLLCIFLYVLSNSYINFFLLKVRSDGQFLRESIYIASNNILSLILFLLLTILSFELSTILLWLFFFKFVFLSVLVKYENIPFRLYFNLKEHGFELSKGLKYVLLMVVGTLYVNVDTIVLGYYLSIFEIGLYQTILQMVMAACILSLSISQVYLQKFTSAKVNVLILKREFYKIQVISIAIGLIAAVTFYFLCAPFLGVFFEYDLKEYGIEVVLYGAILLFLRYSISPLGSFLTAVDKTNLRVVFSVLSIFVSVILTVILVGSYGIKTGFIAGIFAHIVMFLSQFLVVVKYFDKA